MRAILASLAAILVVAGAFSLPVAAEEAGEPDETETQGTGTGNQGSSKPSERPPACSQPADNPCHDARFNDCMRKAREGDGQVDPAEAQACTADFCAKHPGTQFCARWCNEHPDRAACAKRPAPMSGAKPRVDEHHITFQPTADGFANLTVRGRLILVSATLEADEAPTADHDGRLYEIRAGMARLELHDDASGFVRFQGGDEASLTLVLPPGVTHSERGPGGIGPDAKLTYPDGTLAFLNADDAEWTDAQTIVATGFLGFHLAPGQSQTPGAPSDMPAKLREKGDKLGAEIRFAKGEGPQVLAYDRLNVTFKQPKDRPTASDPLRVVLDAELDSGRTVVLHINKTMLDTDEGGLVVRYFDLPEGANATETRTEVLFQRASSLDDILDPADDAGQPEYWIVRDANGLQVLVSVPHWSAHMIELSALTELVQPSVLIGVMVGLAGTVVAAVVLFVPRRRKD